MSAFRSSPWAPLVSAAFLAVATAAPVSQPMAMAQPAVAGEPGVFTIADGSVSLEAPQAWQRVQPKSGIVETEFAIP